jgi:hypothetical protein
MRSGWLVFFKNIPHSPQGKDRQPVIETNGYGSPASFRSPIESDRWLRIGVARTSLARLIGLDTVLLEALDCLPNAGVDMPWNGRRCGRLIITLPRCDHGSRGTWDKAACTWLRVYIGRSAGFPGHLWRCWLKLYPILALNPDNPEIGGKTQPVTPIPV